MRSRRKIKNVLSGLAPIEMWTVAGKLINQTAYCQIFQLCYQKNRLWEECSHTPRHVHGKQDKSRLPVMYVE